MDLAIRVPLCSFQIYLNENSNHYHYVTNGFKFYQLFKEPCYKKIYPISVGTVSSAYHLLKSNY